MSSLVAAMPRASRLCLALLCALLPAALPAVSAAPDPVSDTPQQRTIGTDEPDTLDTVRVEGHRNDAADSIEQARRRLGERAGATAVVDADRYRDGRVSTLTDALGFAPGVFVQPRFGAEEARLSIRGSGLQRTFHGRGLQLLQDGNPLNLADGGFDFQAVEPLATRYIAVYRGPSALEYGAATLGGAIDFVAPTGRDAAPVQLRAEGGSFGYLRSQIALAGAGEAADGYVSATGFVQEGYRDHAEQENYRLFANGGYRVGETLSVRGYLTHVDTRSALPGNLTFAEFERDPRLAAPGNVALDQRRDFRLDRIAAALRWTPDERRDLRISAYYADKSLDHPIFQVLRQESQDYGVDLRYRHERRFGGLRSVLVAGLSAAQGDIDDDRFVNVAGAPGARTNAFRQRARNLAAYAEQQVWVDERWAFSFGAQALRAERDSRDLFVTGGRDESFATRYEGFSPKLGLRWLPAEGVQAFANVARSFEPPSFGELSGGPGITQVDAQRATSAEVGVRAERERVSLDAALYRARIDGELLALNDGAGNPLGTRNADRTVHQGLELGLGWTIADELLLSANYLWNDFRFDGDAVYGDNRLAGVPEQQLRLQLRWSAGERFYIAPGVDWSPQRSWIDHANTLSAPGHIVVGLRIGGALDGGASGGRWSWFVDGRSLTDRRWVASTGVVADARGLDGRYLLPGDGRAVYAGLQWRWE